MSKRMYRKLLNVAYIDYENLIWDIKINYGRWQIIRRDIIK